MADPDEANDEIWRPDYQGPAPVSSPVRLPTHHQRSPDLVDRSDSSRLDSVPSVFEPHPGADEETTPGRWSPGRTAIGVVAVVAMSIGVVVMVTDSGEEPPDSTPARPGADDDTVGGQAVERYELPNLVALDGVPFAGADPKRLPDTLDPIWSRSVPAAESDDVWVEVIDRRFALVSVGAAQESGAGSSVLQSLDAETGVTRWSTEFAVPPTSLVFVATNATSIVLIVDGTLTGIDAAAGDAVWNFERTPALFESDVERLVGTDLLAIGSPDDTSTLVDMATGETVGRLDGPTIATDHLGRWYVRRGDDIVRYDLGDGFREPTLVAAGVVDPVVAVVGGDVLASGPHGWTTSSTSGEAAAERVAIEGTENFPTASAILPMLGSTFVVAGTGQVVGAEFDGRRLRFAWQRDGAVIAMYPTERGFLVHAATQGGADQTIFDGLDGNAVVTFTITPGLFDSLVVAGNGILTKMAASDGPRLAGLDLDGDEMWSIRGVAAAAVGDRLIVTTSRLDDGSVQLDAVGEPQIP